MDGDAGKTASQFKMRSPLALGGRAEPESRVIGKTNRTLPDQKRIYFALVRTDGQTPKGEMLVGNFPRGWYSSATIAIVEVGPLFAGFLSL